MMLVQKQPAFNLTPVVHAHHRRNPSAPVLAVQPTKIPGMLSISKPQRTTPQRQMVSAQRPQQASKTAPRAKQQTTTAQISPKKSHEQVSPNRGRANKDKKRLSSPSPVRGRQTRQPSPPVEAQQSLQAEEQAPSHNQFDPFVQSSTSSPALSESIPVPSKVVKPQSQKISRSAPKPTNMAPRPARTFNFPICDDDVSEPESAGVPTPPATPVRKHAVAVKAFEAPIGSIQRTRRHRRAPSEGVFAMSSDDELSAGSEEISPALFGLGYPKRPPVTPASSFTRNGAAAAARELNGSPGSGFKVTGFFASSIFQNSPSPDELPNPTLF